MHKISKFDPHPDKIFVTNMDDGSQKTAGGIIIQQDNLTERGVRPRWAQVEFIGENVDTVVVGEYVMVEHGRWSYPFDIELPTGERHRLWQVDPEAIMVATDVIPNEIGNRL